MRSIREALRGGAASECDRGSLPMAILVVVVGMGLAGLLLPMVLSQSSTTRFDNRRALSLQAAESGLDIALGLVRSAVTFDDEIGQDRGDSRKLPCGPISGKVDPSADARYSVTIAYYTADPSGRDDDWLRDKRMSCTSGFGVHYDDGSAKGILVPSFVLVSATGSDGVHEQTRTLQATYTVNTTNVNIDGGALPLFPASTSNPTVYCLDAGVTPAVNTVVKIRECEEPTTDRQKWSYRSNLTIRLTSTIGDTTANPAGTGLCIESAGKDQSVTLQYCPEDKTDASGSPILGKYQQIWGINDNGHFALSNSTKTNLSTTDCLGASALGNDKNVTMQACSGGTTDPYQAFNPRPTAGSGQAGPDEPDSDFLQDKQVVNFLQFSRCIDVTNANPGTGSASSPGGQDFLILYPCKQNPKPSAVLWNQKFTQVTATGGVRWQTRTGSTDYCLTSPLATGTGKYVHVEECATSKNSRQVWTRYEGYTGEGADRAALPTKQRYTLVDSAGLCLGPGPTEDMYNGNLKLIVSTCDGSLGQKWNVPPIEQRPTFTNLHEYVGEG